MASFSLRGPICSVLNRFKIDSGTMCRYQSPTPGPLMCIPQIEVAITQTTGIADIQLPQPAIASLFNGSKLAPARGISKNAYQQAAKALNVDVAIIQAVSNVEVGIRGAFDELGRPTILFEPHKFRERTGFVYDKSNPYVSNSSWGGGYFSEQYKKLNEAYGLNAIAALESASWGAFQIMGFNYVSAGFVSVEAMVEAMMKSEEAQLTAFVNFVKANTTLKQALKDKNWEKFASIYNGPSYAENNYHTKMKNQYTALVGV